jgi:hypothetical protein
VSLRDKLGKFTDTIGITESSGEESAPATPTTATTPPTIHVDTPILSAVDAKPSDIEAVKNSIEADLNKKLPEAYAAFNALVEGLADVIPDEATRVKAALVSADKQGYKGRDILSAFDTRMTAVDDYESAFKESVKRKITTEVIGLENQAAEADRQTKAKQEEIAQLQAELQELAVARTEAQNNAKAAREKINLGERRVTAALSAIRESISKEKALIATFVKGGK